MLYQDYNASIRDIFKQVEGVSQHGLEQLYDEGVREEKDHTPKPSSTRARLAGGVFKLGRPISQFELRKSAKSRRSRKRH